MEKLAQILLVIAATSGTLAVGCMPPPEPQGEERRGTNSGIIGGKPDSGDPAVVAVFAIKGDTGATCTGEVIAPRFVLTASHCIHAGSLGFEPETVVVVTAADTTTATKADVLRVKALNLHPGYEPNSGMNDIAVIELEQPTSIAPLPFHRGSLAEHSGRTGRAIGYGTTVDGDANTSGKKNEAALTISDITATTFLASALPSTQCHGDSGGPVLLEIGGRETIIGIGWRTVRLDGLCNEGVRDTRVDRHAQWIDFVTGAAISGGGERVPAPAPAGDGVTACCVNGVSYECPDTAACLGGFDLNACFSACTEPSCLSRCSQESSSGKGPTDSCTRIGTCN
jgi:secreted trypsin-like serine protease